MSREPLKRTRKDFVQAPVGFLVNPLVAQRREFHRSCGAKGWWWPRTKEEFRQLDGIDHMLAELGFFSRSSAGGES